ncbi:malate dehydrogenase [Candidatus Fermentibacteria bacterium]|nr:MAG: malate dehydrogenase [Candidatus Fermentibacteria bacterium]
MGYLRKQYLPTDQEQQMTPSEAIKQLREKLPPENRDSALTEFLYRLSLDAHRHHMGKMMTVPRVDQVDSGWLEAWYTPGVSAVSRAIRDNEQVSFSHTARGRTVAVVSDSARVPGDGDVTPSGGMGVMEGKALLMNLLGGFDAVPLCLDVNGDMVRFVDTVNAVSPSFAVVNLEDISQPGCYTVLRELQKSCPVPVWHDDAQGTACVTLAGLLNALKVTGKTIESARIVFMGAGAANSTSAKLILAAGAKAGNIMLFDVHGGLHEGRLKDFQGDAWEWHRELCSRTNPEQVEDIREGIRGADVLIAASKPGPDTIHPSWIRKMADNAIVFACANPVPEIYPDDAFAAGAAIVATGRGDYPNQVNNSLGFPGILKGVLLSGATAITDRMAVAAGRAIADYAVQGIVGSGRILPAMTDTGLFPHVAAAVAAAARSEGVARIPVSSEEVYRIASEDMKAAREAWAAVTATSAVKPYPEKRLKELLKQILKEYQ